MSENKENGHSTFPEPKMTSSLFLFDKQCKTQRYSTLIPQNTKEDFWINAWKHDSQHNFLFID